MSIKAKDGVMAWVEDQLPRDEKLREAVDQRLAKFHVQEELVARILGVSQPAVAKLEGGGVKNLERKTLLRWVTALGGELTLQLKPAAPAKVVRIRRQRATKTPAVPGGRRTAR